MPNSRSRILGALSAAAAAVALVLVPSTSASAKQPSTFTIPSLNFYDVLVQCPAVPALSNLTVTVTGVGNRHVSKDGTVSTPGVETLTWTNADGRFITIQDAAHTTTSASGDTQVRSGLLWRVVASSTGAHRNVTAGGRVIITTTYGENGPTNVIVSHTGRTNADICAVAIDALSS